MRPPAQQLVFAVLQGVLAAFEVLTKSPFRLPRLRLIRNHLLFLLVQFVTEVGDFFGSGHLGDPSEQVFTVDFLLFLRVLEQECVRLEVEDLAISVVVVLDFDRAFLGLVLEVDVALA